MPKTGLRFTTKMPQISLCFDGWLHKKYYSYFTPAGAQRERVWRTKEKKRQRKHGIKKIEAKSREQNAA